jgi:DNA-binding NtrC family response regulator
MDMILLIDDEQAVLDGQLNLLRLNGYTSVVTARTGAEAKDACRTHPVALAILDLTLENESGLDLLRWFSEERPDVVVLVVTGASDVKLAVECMRAGAHDFLVKGTDTGRLPAAVRNAIEHRNVVRENERLRDAFVRKAPRNPDAFAGFVTVSDQMHRIFLYLDAIAPLPDPILITGETGVGKEVIARAIHAASGLTGPFVPVNLGGLDDHVVSDTLFGHQRGAYTGADKTRDGLIRTAAGGTLFLDEFAELAQESQTKLLRLLDSGEFMPLGSDRREHSEARILLATNRDLDTEITNGRFRKDLYYRVAAHRVHIPPLRQRPEDIKPILTHLMDLHSQRLGRNKLDLDDTLVGRLSQRSLAGNVRELEQLVLTALIDGRWNGLRESDTERNAREVQATHGTPHHAGDAVRRQEPAESAAGRDARSAHAADAGPRAPAAKAAAPGNAQDTEATGTPAETGATGGAAPTDAPAEAAPTAQSGSADAIPAGAGSGLTQAATQGPVRFGGSLPTPSEAVAELLKEANRRYPDNRSAAAAAVGLSAQAFANRWRRMVEEGQADPEG